MVVDKESIYVILFDILL